MSGRLDAYLNSPTGGGEPYGVSGGATPGPAGAAPARASYHARPHEPFNGGDVTVKSFMPKVFADKFEVLKGLAQVTPKEREEGFRDARVPCTCSQMYRDSCVQSVHGCCAQFAGKAADGPEAIAYYHCAHTQSGGLAYVGVAVVDTIVEPPKDHGKGLRDLQEQLQGNKFELDRELKTSKSNEELGARRKQISEFFFQKVAQQLSAIENDTKLTKHNKQVLLLDYQKLMIDAQEYFRGIQQQIDRRAEHV